MPKSALAKNTALNEAKDLFLAMNRVRNSQSAVIAIMLFAADDMLRDGNIDEVADLLYRVETTNMGSDDPRFTSYDLADAIAHTPNLDLKKLAVLSDEDLLDAVSQMAEYKRHIYSDGWGWEKPILCREDIRFDIFKT